MTARRARVARTILLLLAAASLIAVFPAISAARAAPEGHVFSEIWIAATLPLLAALYALLGFSSRPPPGLWEAVLAQKATLCAAALLVRESDEAIFVGASEGVQLVLLAAAYWLVQAWRAWSPRGVRNSAAGP